MPMPTYKEFKSQFTSENPFVLHLSNVMKVWVYPDPENKDRLKFKTSHNGEQGLKKGVHHDFVNQIWTMLKDSENQLLPLCERITLNDSVEGAVPRELNITKRKPPCVTNNDMIARAQVLYEQDPSRKIALLNPENAELVGGGAFCGAPNFEECLFRITNGLAFSYLEYSIKTDNLTPADGNTDARKKEGRPSYTKDHNSDVAATYVSGATVTYGIVATPGKPWEQHSYQKLAQSFPVDIVGNASVALNDSEATAEHEEFIKEKIRAQLYAAKQKGVTDLLLTDFGCGGFNNDPALIAQWYAELIIEGDYEKFMNIEFCVKSAKNFTVFKTHFDAVMKIHALKKLAKNVPSFSEAVRYGCSTENKYNHDDAAQYQNTVELAGLPITDHAPAVAPKPSAAGLVVVGLNVCAPFSPIGKNIRPDGAVNNIEGHSVNLKAQRRFDLLPAHHETQMKKMAAYVFDLLKAGADVIALQEVPKPLQDKANYDFFVNELQRLVNAADRNLGIAFNSRTFEQSLQKTSNTRSCLGVVVNEARVKSISQPKSALNGRAAEYEITTVDGRKETLVNMHADYNEQQKTAAYIQETVGLGKIIVGDPNLTEYKMLFPGETGEPYYHHDIACSPGKTGMSVILKTNVTDIKVEKKFGPSDQFKIETRQFFDGVYTLIGENEKGEKRILQFQLDEHKLPIHIKMGFPGQGEQTTWVDYDPSKHHWGRILLCHAQTIFPDYSIKTPVVTLKTNSLHSPAMFQQKPVNLDDIIKNASAYAETKKPPKEGTFDVKYGAALQLNTALEKVKKGEENGHWLNLQLKYIEIAYPDLFKATFKSELKGYFDDAYTLAQQLGDKKLQPPAQSPTP